MDFTHHNLERSNMKIKAIMSAAVISTTLLTSNAIAQDSNGVRPCRLTHDCVRPDRPRAVPEIDGAGAIIAISLLAGIGGIIRERKNK